MSGGDYPGTTKTLSVNYLVDGTRFALADDEEDDLDERDLRFLSRALEEHEHGSNRGLPIRRIDVSSSPNEPGTLQVLGDDFRWWGNTAAAVRTAVRVEGDQTVDGVKRFTGPLLLPRQVSAPAAPGVGLAYLYLGPGDRLFLRSGTNVAAPVGTPALLAAALNWQTNQGSGEALLQQVGTANGPLWTLAFRTAGNDACSLGTSAPPTYGGTPITAQIEWLPVSAGTGKVNFTLLARVTPVGQSVNVAATEVGTVTVDAPDAAGVHQRATLVWSAGLPAGGDLVHYVLRRDDAKESAAGTRFTGTANVATVNLVYG